VDLGVLEQKLRALPGVLDCSVSAEGVAVVVHPEVDPRLIEMQAQVLLGEAGDRRPLLVVGGMTAGPRVLPPTRPPRAARAKRTGPSPLSLAVFAFLVLALLAVVPIAGRDSRPDRATAPAAQRAADRPPPPGLGRVPLDDEEEILVAGPPLAPEAPTPEAEPVETVDLGGVQLASSASPVAPPVVPSPQPVAAAPATADPMPPSAGEASSKAGKGARRVERAGPGRGAGGGVSMAAATGPPGKAHPPGKSEPPGRRRGHHR
jgi:hypothetical protein